ncbi:MAG: phosphate-starvation-inducible rane protein PsiE [Thermoleophilia bacterium]|nr:phosphate-starvation-inducible rane protein PsiE [Thermoleophilia bacterium]
MADQIPTLVPHRDRRPLAPAWLLRAIHGIDDLVHVCIAVLLLGLAIAVMGNTVLQFFDSDQPFALAVTYAVNGVLFVIILMEILRTVITHFTQGTFQLMPFVAIGIISAVRHILTVGSALTLGQRMDDGTFDRLLLELAVNTGVAIGLVVALVLLRRSTLPHSDERMDIE